MVRMLMLVVALSVTGGAVAFAESKTVAEGYRVMAYDARAHQYTIHGYLNSRQAYSQKNRGALPVVPIGQQTAG
jgi:hypothetical protein